MSSLHASVDEKSGSLKDVRKSSADRQGFILMEALGRVRHILPAQAPIRDFVHHNTLHAFQDRDFDIAIVEAAAIFGANAYLPLSEYRETYRNNQISEWHFLHEIRNTLPPDLCSHRFFRSEFTGESFVQYALWEYEEYPDQGIARAKVKRESFSLKELDCLCKAVRSILKPSGAESRSPRLSLIRRAEVDLDRWVNPILIRLIGSYLDQGICLWEFPHREMDFFSSFLALVKGSFFPISDFVRKGQVLQYSEKAAEQVVEELLGQLCPDPLDREDYLRETLLAHPGWSGMVAFLEDHPSQLQDPRPIRLIDFLAVKLVLESEAISNRPRNDLFFQRYKDQEKTRLRLERRVTAVATLLLKLGISGDEILALSASNLKVLGDLFTFVSAHSLAAIWHRAMESTLYSSALSAIEFNALRNSQVREPRNSKITAVFCIDDRECSVRRYLESEDSEIVTEATAGFFGIDFLFQSIHDAVPGKYCPLPVRPRHIVREKRVLKDSSSFFKKQYVGKIVAMWKDHLSSPFLGWLMTSLSAPWFLVKLLSRVYLPTFLGSLVHRKPVQGNTEFEFIRTDDAPADANNFEGYSYEEMADRVFHQLTLTGVRRHLSPLIVMVAHGSASVNNPHFSAYDCGACSGRPGAANARTFALMANHPKVREILKSRGMEIPETTLFLGAFHDTCRDTFTFFDDTDLDNQHADLLKRFKKASSKALIRNSKERARRLESVPLTVSASEAHQEMEYRSLALFEPRPELNHANNALCIIGRRYLTRRLFLDRRAFLQSYNPDLDVDGRSLQAILSAVVPVCCGINLEYFFSRVDNEVYGSGTKLPHNVASLIGVMNGVDGDLRTGLPRQMVEIHDPIRCLFIVEQCSEVLKRVLDENPAVSQWFENRWASLVALDPVHLTFSQYFPKKGFVQVPAEWVGVPIVANVDRYLKSTRDNLKFALITAHRSGSAPSEVEE